MDYSKALGSNLPVGSKQIVVFIPEKDKEGKKIKQNYWVEEAMKCLGQLFRGATAFPPGKGIWRNDEVNELLIENTVMVISYINPKDLNKKNLQSLRAFLHRMGIEANQGEIGIVIDGNYYGISEYDLPEKGRKK